MTQMATVNAWLVYAPRINERIKVEPLLAMKTTKSVQLNTKSMWLKYHGVILENPTNSTTKQLSSIRVHYKDMTHWSEWRNIVLITVHYEMESDHGTLLAFMADRSSCENRINLNHGAVTEVCCRCIYMCHYSFSWSIELGWLIVLISLSDSDWFSRLKLNSFFHHILIKINRRN